MQVLVCLGALVALRPAFAGAVSPTPTPGPNDAYIVELTAPPLARLQASLRASQGGAAADAQRARLRQLIVTLENQNRQAQGLGVLAVSTIIRHEYRIVLNGLAARLSPTTVAALRADPDVRRVSRERRAEIALDVSVPLVRAPQLWSDSSYRGAGTTIAVIDTGVDYTHPDLGGCLGAGCKVVGGSDFVNGDSDPADDYGQGTHVAAIAAGNGTLLGVAPDAAVLAYKVLDGGGYGVESDIIAAVERATDPNDDGNPDDHVAVIDMSLAVYG